MDYYDVILSYVHFIKGFLECRNIQLETFYINIDTNIVASRVS